MVRNFFVGIHLRRCVDLADDLFDGTDLLLVERDRNCIVGGHALAAQGFHLTHATIDGLGEGVDVDHHALIFDQDCRRAGLVHRRADAHIDRFAGRHGMQKDHAALGVGSSAVIARGGYGDALKGRNHALLILTANVHDQCTPDLWR